MQAVILAAGMGSRLEALSGGKAKALVEIGGRPLILHQLEMLADHGIGPVIVVVGFQADDVRRVIGERATIVVNENYEKTNSLYSLWLAREQVRGPFILLNCDLFFHPAILDRVLDEKKNALAYDSTSSRGREQTKVAVKDRKIVDLGKDLPAGSARGESLGLLKLDDAGGTAMLQMADFLIRDGHEKAWVIEATRAVCQMIPITGVNIAGLPWTEIDFPYDLDVARREVWPLIWKGRWRRHVYWKRTRWAALLLVVLGFAVSGWYAATRVGPASVDWETVRAATGRMALLRREGSEQEWYDLTMGETLRAAVRGPGGLIETRAVLPDSGPARVRYVVEITVDGQPMDWMAFTAQPDTSARVDEHHVGDKDRIRLDLSPGVHQVGVRLIAGHAARVLVRVRRADAP